MKYKTLSKAIQYNKGGVILILPNGEIHSGKKIKIIYKKKDNNKCNCGGGEGCKFYENYN